MGVLFALCDLDCNHCFKFPKPHRAPRMRLTSSVTSCINCPIILQATVMQSVFVLVVVIIVSELLVLNRQELVSFRTAAQTD